VKKVIAVHPFTLKRCANPVVDGSRYQTDYLSGLSSLTKSKHRLPASSLSGRREAFDFLEHNVIQIEMIRERREIAPLLADDLRC
jgi:hypothetical protein